MAIGSRTLTRREKVRRQRTGKTLSGWGRLRAAIGVWSALVVLLFVAAATGIALYGTGSLSYAVGQKVDQPILARVDFQLVNEAQTEQDRQAARAAAPSVYETNTTLIADLCLSVQTLYQDAQAETFEQFAELAQSHGWPAEEELYRALRDLMGAEQQARYARWVEELRSGLRQRYTYRVADSQVRQPRAAGPKVRVISRDPNRPEAPPSGPEEVLTIDLRPISSLNLIEDMATGLAEVFEGRVLRQAVRGRLVERLSAEPLLQYNATLTEEAMREAAVAVPPAIVSFKRGQPIVSPQGGEAVVLEDAHLALLQAEHRRYVSLLAGDDRTAAPLRNQVFLERAGTAAIMVVLSLFLFLYTGLYRRRILEVRTRTTAFAVLILALLAVARLIHLRAPYEELIVLPAMIVAACLTLAYPRHFALGASAIACLLVVQAAEGNLGLLIVLLAASAVIVHLLDDIRRRTQIILAGFWTAGLVFLVTFAHGLIDKQAVGYAATRGAWGAGSAITAALAVQGFLPFIERAFRIATSLTLLEWTSADKPALQRLAREAPGTYNHSLVLGTMAQAACDAIGANGLLVRVGALYHDLGKVHKADYFTENQQASINRHDKLSASMSLLIILGHVKDGIELAREYGLPRVLYPFIEEHHGTTVVRYFHHKASEQAKQAGGRHEREVSEAEFRYPGPKPHSREAAVLMICDGVEGAVRALAEPTVGRIESIVHQVIMDRLNDGQFGDCDITLKELHTVEESVVKSLSTFYHGRVSYPKGPSARSETSDSRAGQPLASEAKGRAVAGGSMSAAPSSTGRPSTERSEQRQPV